MSNNYNPNFEQPGSIQPELQPIAEDRYMTVVRAAMNVAEINIPDGV